MIMEYELKNSGPEDENWVNALTEETMGAYIRETWPTDEEYRHYLKLNRFDQVTTRIIIINGKKTGRLSLRRDAETIHLDNLHLKSSFQGSGLGTRIILDVIKLARSEGRALELKCLKTNPVRNLYARMGFSLIKEDEQRLYYRIA